MKERKIKQKATKVIETHFFSFLLFFLKRANGIAFFNLDARSINVSGQSGFVYRPIGFV